MNETTYDLPDPLITVSPEWLGGQPIFTGRRVPIRALFDYIEGGHPLDEFLDQFPSVSREHAVAVLKASEAAMVLRSVEDERVYHASEEELAAVDEALGQIERGERASDAEVEAAFARFRA